MVFLVYQFYKSQHQDWGEHAGDAGDTSWLAKYLLPHSWGLIKFIFPHSEITLERVGRCWSINRWTSKALKLESGTLGLHWPCTNANSLGNSRQAWLLTERLKSSQAPPSPLVIMPSPVLQESVTFCRDNQKYSKKCMFKLNFESKEQKHPQYSNKDMFKLFLE